MRVFSDACQTARMVILVSMYMHSAFAIHRVSAVRYRPPLANKYTDRGVS